MADVTRPYACCEHCEDCGGDAPLSEVASNPGHADPCDICQNPPA